MITNMVYMSVYVSVYMSVYNAVYKSVVCLIKSPNLRPDDPIVIIYQLI